MLRKGFYLLFLFPLIFGCQEGDVAYESDSADMDSVAFDYRIVDKEIGRCEEMKHCAAVYLQRLEVREHEQINWQLDSLFFAIDELEITTVDGLVDYFLREYEALLEEIPDYNLPWEMTRRLSVNYNNYGLLGVTLYDYSFTGGAHGTENWYFYHFNTAEQRQKHWTEFFDESMLISFVALAERRFKAQQGLQQQISYDDAGFWFENDVFTLPNNMRLDDEGIVFLYNRYEIAPYAEGEITLALSWEEVHPYLNQTYANFFNPADKQQQ